MEICKSTAMYTKPVYLEQEKNYTIIDWRIPTVESDGLVDDVCVLCFF